MYDNDKRRDEQIDRYLRHQLSAAELAEFEIRMLEDPGFFNAVKQAELMYSSFKGQEPRAGPGSDISYLPFRLWIKQPMSLAASLMLGIGILLLVSLYPLQPGANGLADGFGVSSVINIGQTRGTTSEIVLPEGNHLLQVDVGVSLVETLYWISLRHDGGDQQYLFQVSPDGNGVIRVITPSNLQGRYELAVQRLDSSERAATYHIKFN